MLSQILLNTVYRISTINTVYSISNINTVYRISNINTVYSISNINNNGQMIVRILSSTKKKESNLYWTHYILYF